MATCEWQRQASSLSYHTQRQVPSQQVNRHMAASYVSGSGTDGRKDTMCSVIFIQLRLKNTENRRVEHILKQIQ